MKSFPRAVIPLVIFGAILACSDDTPNVIPDGGTSSSGGVASSSGQNDATTSSGEPKPDGSDGKPCGNGVVDPGEECDDGNGNDGDKCTSACTLPKCGDGFVSLGEQCDDGNQVNTDGCLNTCKSATCGDGVIQNGVEACDDGFKGKAEGCTAECTIPGCGDGVVGPGEECDDANKENADSCTNLCKAPKCGDGIKQANEACDDGNQIDGDACTNKCTLPVCGDGVVQAGEECDDANKDETDACRNSCKKSVCGDGVVGPGEACDDGNTVETDGCLNTCKTANCGNGKVDPGEECDDGNTNNGDACLNTCKTAKCGDGVVGPGEECDDANAINMDACLNTCKTAKCGDGVVSSTEECDDGNSVNTDACLNTCKKAGCGDGVVQAGVEQCDDGNNKNTDSCTNACKTAKCGDGFIQAAEECDDGNTNDNDACKNVCTRGSMTARLRALGVDTSGQVPGNRVPLPPGKTVVNRVPELLAWGPAGRNSARLIDNVSSPSEATLASITTADTDRDRRIVAGDLDGDGKDEIIEAVRSGSDIELVAITISGSSLVRNRLTELTNFDANAYEVVLGNVDSDPQLEIVVVASRPLRVDGLTAFPAEQKYWVFDDKVAGYTLMKEGSLASSEGPVRAAVGNLDDTFEGELAFVYGTPGALRYRVLGGQSKNFTQLTDSALSVTANGVTRTPKFSAVKIVDLQQDGVGEIVFAGVSATREAPRPEVDYELLAINGPASAFSVATQARVTSKTGAFPAGFSDVTQTTLSTVQIDDVFLFAGDFDGDRRQEVVVNDLVFNGFHRGGAPWNQAWKLPDLFTDTPNISSRRCSMKQSGAAGQCEGGMASFHRRNDGMSVGDFDGDGLTDIAYTSRFKTTSLYGVKLINNKLEMVNKPIFSLPAPSTGSNDHRYPLVVDANVDNDSGTVELVSSPDVFYTQPIILAVLAAAPCAEGIGQNTAGCSTSYGKAESLGGDITTTMTMSAKVTAGVSIEDRTFSQSEFKATASIGATAGVSLGYGSTVTKSVSFATGYAEDGVIFTSIPYDSWTYKLVSYPPPANVRKEQKVRINVPRDQVTRIVTREFFNAKIGDPKQWIGADILSHTIGDLRSYPRESDADRIVATASGKKGPTGLGVGQGGGITSTAVEVSNQVTGGVTLGLNFSMSAEGTIAGVYGAIEMGASVDATATVTAGSATTFSGSVGSINAANFALAQYGFGMFAYKHKRVLSTQNPKSDQEFHVINYWVK
jgi:cysteine-rich repeat protein